MSWTSIRSNPPGVRRTAAFITTSLCVPRRPNRLASPDGRCRWHSCSRIPFLRLLMFLVFVFSCCFTPHFNPIELRCICGSPILSNHCLFVRIYDLSLQLVLTAHYAYYQRNVTPKIQKHTKTLHPNQPSPSH